MLGERIRQSTTRSVQDPPAYITKTLGTRPTEAAKDRAWVSAVVAVEQYRVENDITDRRTAIGPEPDSYRDRFSWNHVNEAFFDARDTAAPALDPAPMIRGPELGIDF